MPNANHLDPGTERYSPIEYMRLVDRHFLPDIEAFARRSSHFPDLLKAAIMLCLQRDLLLTGTSRKTLERYSEAVSDAAIMAINGHLPANVVRIDRNQ